jgi:hypothetical protein
VSDVGRGVELLIALPVMLSESVQCTFEGAAYHINIKYAIITEGIHECTRRFKKGFTTLRAYISLFEGHV